MRARRPAPHVFRARGPRRRIQYQRNNDLHPNPLKALIRGAIWFVSLLILALITSCSHGC